MPALEPIPPRDIVASPEAPEGALSIVRALLSRPLPWEPEKLREAAAAIEEILARWERYGRCHPGQTEVQLSPHLEGVVEALRAAVAPSRSGTGR